MMGAVFEMNTVVKGLQAVLCYGYWSGIAGHHKVHFKFRETSSLPATQLFIYLSRIMIRMLTNLWSPVACDYPKAGTLPLCFLMQNSQLLSHH